MLNESLGHLDWKYTLFVVFICYRQNIMMHLANTILVADVVENVRLKLQFQSSFSIRLILH